MEILKEYDVIYSNFSDKLPSGLKDKHLVLCRENYLYQWGENVEETMESAIALEPAIEKMEMYRQFCKENVEWMPWMQAEINAYTAFLTCLKDIKQRRDAKRAWQEENPGQYKKQVRRHAKKYYKQHRDELIQVAKDWYAEHREEANERNKKWQAANKEKVDKYQAKYRKKNAEKRNKAARKKYKEEHGEYIRKSGTYYDRHREEILARAKERYREKKAEMEKSKNKEK